MIAHDRVVVADRDYHCTAEPFDEWDYRKNTYILPDGERQLVHIVMVGEDDSVCSRCHEPVMFELEAWGYYTDRLHVIEEQPW